MNAHAEMMDLSFGIAAMGLTLLGLASWRLRSTTIGRSFVAFVCVADLWAMLRLGQMNDLVGVSETEILALGLEILMAALVLRLASQAASATSRVSVGNEALIWIPPVVILMLGDQRVAALWSSAVFATASIRLTRVPLRSWGGFRAALYGTSGAILLPGLVPLAWLGGVSSDWIGVIAPLVICGLGVALFYGLPRLGLLSSDRVHHSSVIEAMSDGVLVVDMNGRLVDFNQAAGEILDLDEGRQSLERLDEALADHPDLVELFNGAIDGQSIYPPESMRRQGHAKTYDLRLSALFDSAGSIRSRILVLRDISDRIEVEEENRRQARHVRMVHQVSAAVYEAETIESGIEKALSLIAKAMDFPLGHFLRSAEEADGSRLVASGIVHCGLRLEPEPTETSVPSEAEDRLGTTSSGVFSADEVRDFDPRGVHGWKDLGFEPAFTLPVLIGQRIYGVFEFFSRERMEVDYGATELLEHVGELVGRAVERKLAEEKIRRLAFRDDLTGLPNRQRFHHLLRGAVSLASRAERSMALLFMDLDGFKKVNDTLGHEAGDKLLAEVATRFARVVRVSDHVGRQSADTPESATFRLGGDEFTVLLTEIANPADAALVAERLLATLERPIVVDGQELFIGTSIGIAVYPEDGEDTESLLRNADAAMYFAKGRGRNGYQFYAEDMNRTRSSRLAIEARLRGALEREDFVLHYQPILDAETGEIIAAEALLRWVDEERGFVPPDEFIPVAEETGLIVSIGKWAFRTACIQAQRWREDFQTTIRIGVNVSGHQIRERSMVDTVREALSETGVAPDQVELEITESTIMQDDALTVSTLRELKQMGVGLSLDDFGTGYSSLSYLRRFTIDRVKIDRSFVSELPGNADDAALTAAIVAMAHGLRLKVVAEGVETAQQALFLRQRGCDELQGYLFGRPCPADEFVDLLRARPRSGELWKDDGSEG